MKFYSALIALFVILALPALAQSDGSGFPGGSEGGEFPGGSEGGEFPGGSEGGEFPGGDEGDFPDDGGGDFPDDGEGDFPDDGPGDFPGGDEPDFPDEPDIPVDQPAVWDLLNDVIIKQGTPDQIIYPRITEACDDVDSPRQFSIISRHANFQLSLEQSIFNTEFDLVIKNLDATFFGSERVVLSCNGIQNSFLLTVQEVRDEKKPFWLPLVAQHIKQGSPDGTVVYDNLAKRCINPHGPAVVSVEKQKQFKLFFGGDNRYDLLIGGLSPMVSGRFDITVSCSGTRATFPLIISSAISTVREEQSQGPQRAVRVSSIQIPNQFEMTQGDILPLLVSVTNTGDLDLDQTTITVSSAELGIRYRVGPFNFDENDHVRKTLIFDIPDDVPPGTYYVRISIDSNGLHRVIHRPFIVA